jgi:hypothetical protein
MVLFCAARRRSCGWVGWREGEREGGREGKWMEMRK